MWQALLCYHLIELSLHLHLPLDTKYEDRVEDAFDIYLGGDSNVGNKKTGKPAIYACEKLGLIPENVISIGDAKMDFDMAHNAGLKGSILVSTGQNTIQQLKKISETSITCLDCLSIKVR